MIGFRLLRLALLAAGTAGGLSGAAYGLLSEQSRRARRVIGTPTRQPLRADGIFLPEGAGPLTAAELGLLLESQVPAEKVLNLAVLGDSSACGLGVDFPDELPGVRIARGLADELGKPVRLRTFAQVGSTSAELDGQVTEVLATEPRLVLIIIGANDVTTRMPVRQCAALLSAAVERLTSQGIAVVVGTCPDLGAIRPIPQPLRALARSWSLALGRAQRRAVDSAGGHAVPLADLLSPEFLAQPAELFSPDRFHPSAAGYEAAVSVLLPPLFQAMGAWQGGPLPTPPVKSQAVEARRPTRKLVARLNRFLQRQQTT